MGSHLSQGWQKRARESFKGFTAAWKITELSEISCKQEPAKLSIVASVLSDPIWRLFCLKVNYPNLYMYFLLSFVVLKAFNIC